MTRRRMLKAGRGRVATLIAAVAGLLAAGAPGAMALTGPGGTPGQWSMAGQNIDDTHFQAAEHEISPANVGRLAPRWTLTTAGAISATPTVDDGAVYVPDYGGKLWAVAAGSGRALWSRDISSYTGLAGDQSRTSPAVYGDELILGDGWILSPNTSGARVFAVDRRTGGDHHRFAGGLRRRRVPWHLLQGGGDHGGLVPRGGHRSGRGYRQAAVEGLHGAVEQRRRRLQQARLLQRQRGVGILLRRGPAARAAVRGYREQLQRARRGLYHAGADRVHLARR